MNTKKSGEELNTIQSKNGLKLCINKEDEGADLIYRLELQLPKVLMRSVQLSETNLEGLLTTSLLAKLVPLLVTVVEENQIVAPDLVNLVAPNSLR